MDLLILILISIVSFIFIIYIPTILFYNSSRRIKNNYSILIFFCACLLFLLFDYMCVSFYNLNSVSDLVECPSGIFNFNCFFGGYLTRVINPNLSIMLIFFMQIIAISLYCYVTAIYIFSSKNEKKVLIYMFMLFIISFLSTCIHYIVLNDTLFSSFASIISLVGSNAYVVIPFIYLIVISILNRDKLVFKKNKNK